PQCPDGGWRPAPDPPPLRACVRQRVRSASRTAWNQGPRAVTYHDVPGRAHGARARPHRPMILDLQHDVHAAVAAALRRQFGLTDAPPFTVDVPPSRTMGDLGVTVAFQLARSLRRAPRAIAQDLAAAVEPIPGVARVSAEPNGYLNFHLDRPA